ncbi:MAG: CaiB/BaiF CoA-transferase family protein [Pseudomonadota bacterium]
MKGPLEGIKVLSFARVLSGPYAAMLLADLGADVIKIEDHLKGDMARNNGPFIQDLSSYFLSVNRGKRSFTLNLRHEKGKELIHRLIQKVDILVENFRPGVMKKMGFDYEAARKINPRLVYVSVSGFGQNGPYANKPAFDMVAQGMGGTVSITGEPGRMPVRVGYSIGDLGASLFAAVAALAAIVERERSGLGQHVDVSMLDSQVALCENACARYLATGEIPRPIGTRHPLITPFQIFPTKTDEMVVIAFRNEEWRTLCQVIGQEHLVQDERFQTGEDRNANHGALETILSEVFRTRPRQEWLSLFEENGVVSGPVNNIEQVINDPQIQTREMILGVEHSRLGTVKVVGTPMKFSRTPVKIERASPDLGEHTREIMLEELDYSPDEFQRLKEEGVI